MTGNKVIDNVIIALSLVATAVAVGIFAYTEMIYKKPLPNNAVELEKMKEEHSRVSFPESYRLDAIVVNLPSRTRRLRFLDVQAHLVVFKRKDIALLDNKKPIINDILIDVASGMEPDELNSIAGKLIFEKRVKERINSLYDHSVVRELFYTKFVVQ